MKNLVGWFLLLVDFLLLFGCVVVLFTLCLDFVKSFEFGIGWAVRWFVSNFHWIIIVMGMACIAKIIHIVHPSRNL